MTIEKTVSMLLKNYEKALKQSYIRNPMAYALYHTWRYVDSKGKKEQKEKR